ncbi:hypothetical protein ACJW31_10G100900 [Castanea mollissima]
MVAFRVVCVFLSALMLLNAQQGNGALTARTQKMIAKINEDGPYLGLVIPNLYETDPLLESSNYTATNTIDVAGRRFRFGTIGVKKVILVMTGLSMINAGITTQLLLSLFNVEGVVHYGIAGNANPSLNIGDVTIPEYWAHGALWSWQRYGLGPDDELPLESAGDYTRSIGYLKFANYTVNVTEDGTPEERQHAFWVAVDPHYYEISKQLEDLVLEGCINSTTCLTTTPKVTRVQRGTSASIYIDNAAYRSFIYNKFNVSPADMESASVALICLQQRKPFIAIRALSDLAGGGSADSNEADTFASLAATNSVTVVLKFIELLAAVNSKSSTGYAY